jgi:histidyl-tRNA synthetase
MYTFRDRSGDEITLRPEYTASICRAIISNGLTQSLPLKFFASGPMFRHERPQKGRFRQFHQIDVELIGVPQPQADVEVIEIGAEVLRELGVLDRTVLELNTLGDTASRRAYREALVGYFSKHAAELSEDSRRRLDVNPLRILDSKDEADRRISAGVPSFDQYLNDDSRKFFSQVRAGLDHLGIAYQLSPRLVRGLDYYCHTAFEFVTEHLGAQGTVLGGGRYDGLMALMGGPDTPGVGWAAGIERLAMLTGEPPLPHRPVVVVPVGEKGEAVASRVARDLRRAGFHVDLGYSGNVSRRMKRANKINARVAVLIGEDELARAVATVRDLDGGSQSEVPLSQLAERLAPYR